MYKVNPVQGICKTINCSDQGIQELNDKCFGICASFSGTVDTYNMDPSCTQTCVDLIEKKKKEIYGVGSCDHQVPYRPVIWEEYGRFLPKLLKDGMSPKEALPKCYQLCEQKSPLVAEECKQACLLDYNSLEFFPDENSTLVPPSRQLEFPLPIKMISTEIEKQNPVVLFLLVAFLIGSGYIVWKTYVKK